MSKCFNILPLVISEQANPDDIPFKTYNLLPDSEKHFESIIGEDIAIRYFDGLNNTFRKINFWPWVIIAFKEEYKIAGHLLSIRESREDFIFGAYSLRKEYSIKKNGSPPVSIISVKSKSLVKCLSKKSELFECFWKDLNDKSEDLPWILFPDPIPLEWSENHDCKDDELFFQLYR